jgi:hypothetical protein
MQSLYLSSASSLLHDAGGGRSAAGHGACFFNVPVSVSLPSQVKLTTNPDSLQQQQQPPSYQNEATAPKGKPSHADSLHVQHAP